MSVGGVAALTYAASGPRTHPIAIVAALILFAAAASLLSRVATVAQQLRSFLEKPIVVRAWGNALPGSDLFVVSSVRAISAGLHVYLRPAASDSDWHLKVAQPRHVFVSDSAFEIRDAKYIQWRNRKLNRPMDERVPAIAAEVANKN